MDVKNFKKRVNLKVLEIKDKMQKFDNFQFLFFHRFGIGDFKFLSVIGVVLPR